MTGVLISLTEKQMVDLIGVRKFQLYQQLNEFLISNYQPQVKVTYTEKSGWTYFYRKAGKALTYLNINKNILNVTVVIGASLSDQVLKLPISKKVQEMFKNANQFHDGKWLGFNLKFKGQLDDVEELIQLKRAIK